MAGDDKAALIAEARDRSIFERPEIVEDLYDWRRIALDLADALESRPDLERVKREAGAAALREFARGIDLDALADEWSDGGSAGVDAHWAAGNAASAVQIRAFQTADRIERGE